MKKWGIIWIVGALLFYGQSLLCNISEGYEKVCFIMQYDYAGLHEKGYVKDLSWGKKILCREKYHSPEMMELLRGIENVPIQRLKGNPGRIVGKFAFQGNTFVVKCATQKGIFYNFFRIGAGIDIWNNAHWMKREGISVLEPVALVEKRGFRKVCTFVVYTQENSRVGRNTYIQ